MVRKINLKEDNKHLAFLKVLGGLFSLDEREVLCIYHSQVHADLPFTTNNRLYVREQMGFKDRSSLNNAMKRMIKKKAVTKKQGVYEIHPLLNYGNEEKILFDL